jgi:hypothetical protein
VYLLTRDEAAYRDQHRQSCLTYCVDNGESRPRAGAQYSAGREGPSALVEPTPVGIVADARPLTHSVIAENPRDAFDLPQG